MRSRSFQKYSVQGDRRHLPVRVPVLAPAVWLILSAGFRNSSSSWSSCSPCLLPGKPWGGGVGRKQELGGAGWVSGERGYGALWHRAAEPSLSKPRPMAGPGPWHTGGSGPLPRGWLCGGRPSMGSNAHEFLK